MAAAEQPPTSTVGLSATASAHAQAPASPCEASSSSSTSAMGLFPAWAIRPLQAPPPLHVPHRQLSAGQALLCALLSGTLQAVVFNPYDKALYLSVLHCRPFLAAENFRRPFQGFSQAVLHRIFSGGIFFALEDMLARPWNRVLPHNPSLAACAVGLTAGAANGALLNPPYGRASGR
eukprot:RCo004557